MPEAVEPRTLGELLADSLALARSSAAECSAILAAALLPTLAAATAVFGATGIASKPDVQAAVAAGQYGAILLLIGVGLAAKAVSLLSFAAIVLAVQARDTGAALGWREAYGKALGRIIPFILTQLRAFVYVFLGSALFVVPGLVLAFRYCFVPLAVLVEGRAGKEALARSAQAASAHVLKVLGNVLAAAALLLLLDQACLFALALLAGLSEAAVPGGSSLVERQMLVFVGQMLSGLIGVWATAFGLLLYKDVSQPLPS